MSDDNSRRSAPQGGSLNQPNGQPNGLPNGLCNGHSSHGDSPAPQAPESAGEQDDQSQFDDWVETTQALVEVFNAWTAGHPVYGPGRDYLEDDELVNIWLETSFFKDSLTLSSRYVENEDGSWPIPEEDRQRVYYNWTVFLAEKNAIPWSAVPETPFEFGE